MTKSTRTRSFKQVDVFADALGDGNPVAVVLDAAGLSDDALRKFAAWTNLSETTFVLPPTEPGADYHVRIFTPDEELPFAGHPTIGTCHAWLEAGGQSAVEGKIVQQCGAGLVTLKRIDGRLSFATPPLMRSGPVDAVDLAQVFSMLEIDADDVIDTAWIDNGPGWVGVQMHDVEKLRGLSPAIPAGKWAVGVAALTHTTDPHAAALEVRAFFNSGGTREDPVTGSLNGSLAQWLLARAAITAPYVASQGTALGRNGLISVSQDEDGDIWIGGHAITGIDGTLTL